MLIELLIFIITLILFSILLHRKPKNLPPGEWGLPIVGYVPFMHWKMTKTLGELQKKHGNIFTMKVGSRVFVVLSDHTLIKTAFQKLEFSGRPHFYHFNVFKKYLDNGIIHSDVDVWAPNRRFALRTLRDFGLGKSSILDEIIYTEVESFVQDLKKRLNKPTKIDWSVNVAVLNIIWRLVADKRYDISDKEFLKFASDANDIIEDMEGSLAIFSIFPWLIPVVPNFVKNRWMKMASIERKRDDIFLLIKNIINEHKEKLDPKNPKDYIDKYLVELEEQKNNPEYKHWGDTDLLISVYDLFLAGSETTSSTLRWFMLYMAKLPQIQKKAQKMIDEIVPKGQQISLHDKDKLPYIEAMTFEMNRIISLVPNSVPHKAVEDTVLEGYEIPKGTWILADIWFCHNNPKYWKNPEEFTVENFLDKDGNVIRSKEGYLPFSLGRRACLGESLANMELFVFMGAILQNFEISEPLGQNVPLEANQEVNLMNYPPNFEVILKARN